MLLNRTKYQLLATYKQQVHSNGKEKELEKKTSSPPACKCRLSSLAQETLQHTPRHEFDRTMPVRAGVRAAILRQASRVGTGRGTGGGGGVAGGAEGLRVRARGIFLQAGEAGSRFCGGGAPNTTMASSLSTIQSPVSVDVCSL